MKKIGILLTLLVMGLGITNTNAAKIKDDVYDPQYFVYNRRLKAPDKGDVKYYSSRNPYFYAGYGENNCTTYMYGRFWEVWGDEPKFPLTKAYHPATVYWHAKNDDGSAYKNYVGQTPRLGAIASWSTVKNDNPSIPYSDGHVAIVEFIDSSGNIETTEAGDDSPFFPGKYYKSNGYNYTSGGKTYYFQGFVYQLKGF